MDQQHTPRHDEGRGRGVSPTASSSRAPEATPLQDPTHVGPYRILERLGEGGMGVVYLAEQDAPVRRRVALKVIKLGMDSEEVLARFEAERQALALMDHPNVALVLDAGATEAGRPYFAMEHVPGVPITEYCDTQRLSVQDRLLLFVQVCSAIQHAHQKGVIHRDIKPSNVLVELLDGKPVAKVIDFGVAKALNQRLTERTLFTRQGQLVGTPEYMSPEQAEMTALDVDTRTDIYSLGVLLYELLAGRLPFDPETIRHAAFAEIQRIIREVEPPRPSTRVSTLDAEEAAGIVQRRHADRASLVRQLHDDLDWITMKAMEKDRTRRYASASELAADIERHLRNEPVQAGPPSAAYRLRKFVKRRRGLVLGAGAVAAALLIGLVAALWQAREAERARGLAEAQRARAEAALATARTRLELGLSMGNTLVTKLEASIRTLPGSLDARKLVVDTAMEYLGRLTAGAQDDPLVLGAIADGYEAVADIQGGARSENLGDTAGAIQTYRRSIELRDRQLAATPGDAAVLQRAVDVHLALLRCLRKSNAPVDDSLAELQRARELLEQWPKADATSDAARRSLARVTLDMANVKVRLGRSEEAIADCRASVALRQTLHDGAPEDRALTRDLAVGRQLLGDHLSHAGDQKGGYTEYSAAFTLYEWLVAQAPLDTTFARDRALCELSLGDTANRLGKTDEARLRCADALASLEALVRDNPGDSRLPANLAFAQEINGDVIVADAPADAMRLYRRAIDATAALSAKDPSDASLQRQLQRLHGSLGGALRATGDIAAALAEQEAALSMAEAMRRADPKVALLDTMVAEAHTALGDTHRLAAKDTGRPEADRADRWVAARAHYALADAIYKKLADDKRLPAASGARAKAVDEALAECAEAAGGSSP